MTIKKSSFNIERARAAFSKTPQTQTERSAYYPFYKLPENKSAHVRFIPDANPDNEMGFLLERRQHELTINGKVERVPCLEMWGEKCPICDLSRSYYKAGDKVNGKKFWVKKDWLARALVVKDGLPPADDGTTQQGDVVLLGLGKTLYDIIAHNIASGELGDDLPCDIENGTDFIITRTNRPGPNGEKYGDYNLSKFARQSRPLEEEELAKIEYTAEDGSTPNYNDMTTLLPKKPEFEFVENLLEQALNDDGPVDLAPRAPAASKPTPTRTAPARPVADDEEEGFTPPPRTAAKPTPAPVAEGDDDEAEAQAFLAQIRRNRAAAKATAEDE